MVSVILEMECHLRVGRYVESDRSPLWESRVWKDQKGGRQRGNWVHILGLPLGPVPRFVCSPSESAEMYTSRCGATYTYIIFSKKKDSSIILAENVRRSIFPDLLLMTSSPAINTDY